MQFASDRRRRGISAHATGVGAPVAIPSGLVILGTGEGQRRSAIAQADEAGFLPGEKFLHQHAPAGGAEGIPGQHALHGGQRLLLGAGHGHALAGGQAIGLHHDGRPPFPDIGLGGFQFGEAGRGGGGNAVALQEILGECLGTFQLRRRLARPEASQPAFGEIIDNAIDQGRFRANDGQMHTLALGEFGQGGEILNADGDVFHPGFSGRPGVARRDINPLRRRA